MIFLDNLLALITILVLALMATHWILIENKLRKRFEALSLEFTRCQLHLKLLQRRLLGGLMSAEAKELLQELRNSYLCLVISAMIGSRAEQILGGGQRPCFLVHADGAQAVLRNTLGQQVKVPTEDITVLSVMDAQGRSLPFMFGDNGHLLVESAEAVLDYGPWLKYEPAGNLNLTKTDLVLHEEDML